MKPGRGFRLFTRMRASRPPRVRARVPVQGYRLEDLSAAVLRDYGAVI